MGTSLPLTPVGTQKWRLDVLNAAKRFAGTPYGTGSGQIDCSHLVNRAYRAAGLSFPQIAANSYPGSPYFTVTTSPLPGDVVYWPGSPHGHVGLVLDPNRGDFIGAQSACVAIANYVTNPYWQKRPGRKFLAFSNVTASVLAR